MVRPSSRSRAAPLMCYGRHFRGGGHRMPFRHAHWFVLALFPLAALAFWRGYVSVLGTSPIEFHIHGITATAWLVMLALQSWSIHAGHRAFHRTNGLASFALFPLF